LIWIMKKKKWILEGYYLDGKHVYEIWMCEDGKFKYKKMKD